MNKSYTEMLQYKTFNERLEYLKLSGVVGDDIWHSKRYINQVLYSSYEWRLVRRKVIIRDEGCDLGVEGYEIMRPDILLIHHINPITLEQIIDRDPAIFDMNNLISVSLKTHNMIHYGSKVLEAPAIVIERKPNDTCPWRN